MRSSTSKLFPPPIVPLRRNLALLIASILFLSSWFFLHIFPWVADGASNWLKTVGLSAGAVPLLFALWKMVGTFAAKTVKSEKASFIERWLRHRRAKGALISILTASVLLFFTTGSIYLENKKSLDANFQLSVLTMENDILFSPLSKLKTSTDDGGLVGGPFFIFPPPGKLRLRLDEPTHWSLENEEPRKVFPWKSVRLSVPDDFVPIELRVLLLVPNPRLFNKLLARGQTSGKHRMEIEIDGKPQPPIDDFRRGVVWLGGSKKQLEDLKLKESDSDMERRFEECNPLADDEKLNILKTEPIFHESDIIREDHTVTITLVNLEKDRRVKKVIQASDIAAGKIKTICLEAKNL
jgi:hypothetical protein